LDVSREQIAGSSPNSRDAMKREIWEWKTNYLNYLERME
jgi:hypothetical protein